MIRAKCIQKTETTHPACLRDEEYELVEDFIWRGRRFLRIRFANGTEVDASPEDFVILGENESQQEKEFGN